ncbi:superoxide dismutase, Ni [Thalassotalea euphylliae]|uniref:Superoxide dismutase, Ni n=1 Tax=Thalassotalea euphylliae TaxID=1655234 RepID=A0A3E0UE19_9GAMM|nr:superoxide dismutase, Ni [Thalassotalea euphylliae]REL35238.1 superoxide dismutase, Ni [Thalassotalea euphylliae]
MIFEILSQLDKKNPFDTASAHCDIPCKIYDPMSAQLAVLTMIRMVDLLEELKAHEQLSFEQQATFNRLVAEKESHGKTVKEEIRVIWGDYIKQPQLDAHPQLHQLTHEIMLAASFAKQHIDRTATLKLLDKVNQFADIFWQTKGVATYTANCPYPPSENLVYPDLKAEG